MLKPEDHNQDLASSDVIIKLSEQFRLPVAHYGGDADEMVRTQHHVCVSLL